MNKLLTICPTLALAIFLFVCGPAIFGCGYLNFLGIRVGYHVTGLVAPDAIWEETRSSIACPQLCASCFVAPSVSPWGLQSVVVKAGILGPQPPYDFTLFNRPQRLSACHFKTV